MTIETKSLRQHVPLLKLVSNIPISKTHPIYLSVFLDFKERKIKYTNPLVTYVEFPIEIPESDEKGVFVNCNEFLLLVDNFASFDFDPISGIAKTSDGEFNIGVLELKDEDFEFAKFDQSGDKVKIDSSSEVFAKISRSTSLLPAEENTPLSAVFIRKGNILSTDSEILYTAKDDSLKKDFYVTKLMSSIIERLGGSVEIYFAETFVEIFSGDTGVILPTSSIPYDPPEIENPEFIKEMKHPATIEVNLKSFIELLSFMKPFFDKVPQGRMKLYVENVNDAYHLVVSKTDSKPAKRELPVNLGPLSQFDFFKGNKLSISYNSLLSCMKSPLIESETVVLHVSFEHAALGISSVNRADEAFMACLLLEDF